MKQWSTFIIISIVIGLGLLFSAGISYTGGSPGAKTGSPGDNNQSCTACHSGTAIAVDDLITSNIPVSGYVPGETYSFEVSVAHESSKFGFEATAERIGNQKVGTFVITNAEETKLANNSNAVTHKSDGTAGIGSRTWSFDWIAPSEGSGPITFYAAFNATNGNGNTSGDVVYTSQMAVDEVNTGVAESQVASFNVYPVPCNQFLNFDIYFNKEEVFKAIIYDNMGKIVRHRMIDYGSASAQSFRLFTGDLSTGSYILKVFAEEQVFTKRILINR